MSLWPLWLPVFLLASGSLEKPVEESMEVPWEVQEFREQLTTWATLWEGQPEQQATLTVLIQGLVRQVDFSLAVKYASWAADEKCSAGVGTYAVAAVLLEAVALLPKCLEELRSRSELQTRCPQRWYKIAIQKLLSLGEHPGAEAVWRRASALKFPTEGGEGEGEGEAVQAIPWPSVLETPSIWVRGLPGQPFWDCHSTWPFVRTLEAQAQMILSEARQAAPQLRAAYPYLFAQGSWQNFFLFRGSSWNSEVCTAMPRTCNLLIPEIPTRPGLPFVVPNNEEIVLFRSEPGAIVGPHSGAVNNQINIHLTLVGGEGVTLVVGEERRELQAGKAICFQDSFVHSVEHRSCSGTAQQCPERISLVVRVFHPEWSMTHYGQAARTDAVEDLSAWQTGAAATQELLALREHFRRLADLHGRLLTDEQGEPSCEAEAPTEPTWRKTQQLFAFLSQPYGDRAWGSSHVNVSHAPELELEPESDVDAIVVLSNWYDRLSKVQKVLELARRHQTAHIVIIGGRGRLSSIRAAELDGEAHATLARLLVLLEIPGELGAISSDRLVAISCNECTTAQERERCGCVGNTGFNTDRFLDWAAAALPPVPERLRHVVFVEESFLVRRVAATVLGRLAGGFGHTHSLTTMEISVVNARLAGDEGLKQVIAAHSAMPAAVPHLMAGEVLRLEEYSQGAPGAGRRIPAAASSAGEAGEHGRGSPGTTRDGALFSRGLFLYADSSTSTGSASEVGSEGGPATAAGTAAMAGSVSLEQWDAFLGLARELDRQWEGPMRRVSLDRRIFWRCVAPRDIEAPLWMREVSEAPGEAWRFWKCPQGETCPT